MHFPGAVRSHRAPTRATLWGVQRSEPDDGADGPVEPPLGSTAPVLGLVLASGVFAGLLPDGRSFFDLIWAAFGRSLLEGIVMTFGFGSPFLFGLAVAVGALLPQPQLGARLVRGTLSLLHSQLILTAWSLFRAGGALAALPLLGFSVVSAVYFALHLASTRAGGRPPTLRWHIRWGCTILMGICAWARLQMFAGLSLGWAVTVVLGASALLLRVTNDATGRQPDA